MPANDDAWVGSRAHLDDERYHTDSDYEDEDDDEKVPTYLTRKEASERLCITFKWMHVYNDKYVEPDLC